MNTIPRTTLNGVEQSWPNEAARPDGASMGHCGYQENTFSQCVFDSTQGKWLPMGGISFLYDFAVHGGALGSIDLGAIPAGFVCTQCTYDVITAFADGGSNEALLTLTVNVSEDVLQETQIDDPVVAVGLHPSDILWTAQGTWIKASADRQLTLDITDLALTAGKMRIFMFGFMSSLN